MASRTVKNQNPGYELGELRMMCRVARVGALAVLGILLAGTAWAQNDQNNESRPSLRQPAQGDAAKDQKAPPAPTPEDVDYQAVLDARNGEPAKMVELGEAFVAKYPMSAHELAIYSLLAPAYMVMNQVDKMVDVGNKALQMDPDDVDILPILAWAVPRRANGQTPEGLQQLQKAQAWAHHGIELLSALAKPDGLDQATFDAAKNEKLSMCHDGLGVVDVKTGKYDDAMAELTQAMQLENGTDPVDYLLLGVAQASTSHFADAIASFTKCATDGPVQTQCKNGLDDAKKKAAKNVEAPK
jgi:tetratricopeptide (TPR) repeat protein